MELAPGTAHRYIRHALTQMLFVATRLGDDKVNQRPVGPNTNAVGSLIIHSCAVAEFWLGHVGLGRASERARDDEFAKTATLEELASMVGQTLGQVDADLKRIDGGAGSEFAAGRQFLLEGDESDSALIVHVIEELFQHLGHAELAADVLLAPA